MGIFTKGALDPDISLSWLSLDEYAQSLRRMTSICSWAISFASGRMFIDKIMSSIKESSSPLEGSAGVGSVGNMVGGLLFSGSGR